MRVCSRPVSQDYSVKKYEAMMNGANRQPCAVCSTPVKAEYGFCHACGEVLCERCYEDHLQSGK